MAANQQTTLQNKGPRIYLAGPEVFLANAISIGERKKELCALYGYEGVYPIDPEVDLSGLQLRDAALKIGRLNEELIRSCRAVLANITPFRGPSADVGSVYEMGYARGLGHLVCAYTNVPAPFTARTAAYLKDDANQSADGRVRDGNGMAIEDWGLADNLMIESSIAGSGGCFIVHNAPTQEIFTAMDGFEKCLQAMRAGNMLV